MEGQKKREPPATFRSQGARILAITYFPTPIECSIIGAAELNCRVRKGNGCFLRAMVARNLFAVDAKPPGEGGEEPEAPHPCEEVLDGTHRSVHSLSTLPIAGARLDG